MSKNNILSFSLLTLMIMNLFTRVAFADIAPDPMRRAPGILAIILIVCLVIAAILLLIKFFKK
ncbi:MAG: hypothetical protein IKF80_10780 [Erysipelotrichaceae bacterium]|nr:hypothetical protein [Erysipelotrichaceae bacterium]